jgi:hypothetical protein
MACRMLCATMGRSHLPVKSPEIAQQLPNDKENMFTPVPSLFVFNFFETIASDPKDCLPSKPVTKKQFNISHDLI